MNDFKRNREGRLSSRQWLELITEPLTSLLLLSVPLALLLGRYGMAGRFLVIALIVGFLLTVAMARFSFRAHKTMLSRPLSRRDSCALEILEEDNSCQQVR